jgi:hypothetical protein
MNNFAITAMSRSGTKFLAEVMNRSKVWTVDHEPPGGWNDKGPGIQRRLMKDNYGEVNTFMRLCWDEIEVQRRGVIVRNPKHLLKSYFNLRQEVHLKHVKVAAEGLRLIDQFAEAGATLIRFEEMTSSHAYLQEVLSDFDIIDVDVTKVDLKKKINQRPMMFAKWIYIDKGIREMCEKEFAWFVEKYGYDVDWKT